MPPKRIKSKEQRRDIAISEALLGTLPPDVVARLSRAYKLKNRIEPIWDRYSRARLRAPKDPVIIAGFKKADKRMKRINAFITDPMNQSLSSWWDQEGESIFNEYFPRHDPAGDYFWKGPETQGRGPPPPPPPGVGGNNVLFA